MSQDCSAATKIKDPSLIKITLYNTNQSNKSPKKHSLVIIKLVKKKYCPISLGFVKTG